MGWQEEARRKAGLGEGGFRTKGVPLIGGPESAPPRDRFGKPLKVGDLVLYRPPMDLVFQVVGLDRASRLGNPGDPVPPGDPMLMILEIQVPIQTPGGGQPMQNIVTIGYMARPAGDENVDQPLPTADQGAQPMADQGGVGGTEDATESATVIQEVRTSTVQSTAQPAQPADPSGPDPTKPETLI